MYELYVQDIRPIDVICKCGAKVGDLCDSRSKMKWAKDSKLFHDARLKAAAKVHRLALQARKVASQ